MTESKKGCPNCDGQGFYEIGPAGWVMCPDCKGTGGHAPSSRSGYLKTVTLAELPRGDAAAVSLSGFRATVTSAALTPSR